MPDIFATPVELKVKLTNELIRIAALPRRSWDPESAEALARELTDILRTERGEMGLRAIQAIALYELGTTGGLFAPISVGEGKTLISFLAPMVTFATRPLMIIPAKLMKKTERDRRVLGQHWRMPEFFPVVTYEWLGRAQAAEFLETFDPDLVVLDEGHKASNFRKASVARRLRRFFALRHRPDAKKRAVKCVILSGTITKRSLLDFAHLLRWCFSEHPERMPMPLEWTDLELWADALDERKEQATRADPGSLDVLCSEDELEIWKLDSKRAARMAFRRRLVETAGVVASHEAQVDATLVIQAAEPAVSDVVERAFADLRRWRLPDGKRCMDGLEIYRHARELALGFFYRWDPWPPASWLQPRKAWSAFVRKVLKHSRTWDSELQVRRAHPESKELQAWLAVKDTFEPNTVPVWLDESVLEYCAEWARENRGIVWTEHTEFAERLASDHGLAYYGRGGRSATGGLIDDHPPGEPMVASIQSSGEGRNLQAWSRALVTSMPPNGRQTEQLLGRSHRPGTKADEVEYDVICTCREHVNALWQSYRDSDFVATTTGAPQKILVSTIDFPTEDDIVWRASPRWTSWRDGEEED